LIHRRDQFRAHEAAVEQMRAGPTKILTPYELRRLEGDGHLRAAAIYNNDSDTEETLEVDAVLVNIGFISSLGPLQKWGLAIESNAITVDYRMMTSLPGIFAAGDVVSYPGKLKLISVGFGEAAIAVNHAKQHIDPTARLFPGHSSEMKR
jgi:thioredoxin reductase (NADPH)